MRATRPLTCAVGPPTPIRSGWPEALAEAAGLHPTFISNVERGYRVPTVPTMLRIARGLGVSAGRLVDGLEEVVEG